MKLTSLVKRLPKRFIAGGIIALAVALPVASMAADMVTIEGAIGVANVTAGDTSYAKSVNATYDQVVKVQVYYHNKENPDSGKIAQNLNVKINMPTAAGKAQTVSETTKADNSNTVNDSATVNLDRDDAYLQYIPGSAVWRHNTGDNTNIKYQEDKISDAVVTSGLTLENEKPCYNFSATVTVLARVMVPGVKVVKQSEGVNQTNAWSNDNTANPGDTRKYMITYQNTGNTQQNNVVVRDNLPNNMTLVPGSTKIYTMLVPNGSTETSNNISNGGLNIGNYAPGSGAYVTFETKIADADQLTCGNTVFRNTGIAKPENMQEYYNIAVTTVNKQCNQTPATPSYTCDLLDVTQGDNRTVTVKDFKYSAASGATFNNVVLNWGDNTAALTTNNVVNQTHTYAADGTYTISAVAHFTVNGKDVTANGDNCSKTVTFSPAAANTPAAPTTPTSSQPTQLVNTGAGSVIGLFATALVAGVAVHRLFLSRRLSRES